MRQRLEPDPHVCDGVSRPDPPADGERVENSVTAAVRRFSGERAEKSIVGIGLEVGMPVFRT